MTGTAGETRARIVGDSPTSLVGGRVVIAMGVRRGIVLVSDRRVLLECLLIGCALIGCGLVECVLIECMLIGCILTGCVLVVCVLIGCILTGCVLIGCVLLCGGAPAPAAMEYGRSMDRLLR